MRWRNVVVEVIEARDEVIAAAAKSGRGIG
jgi:hypothetical protein